MPDAGRARWDVRVFPRLASTNTTLRELAAGGAAEGTVVVADEQMAGRGRHGRSWHSPAGAGFYGSALFRPPLAAREVGALTFAAAVAAAETISGLGASAVEIKWPNDVLARDRKICGVLTEASFVDERVEWAVVGIGINLTDAAIPPGAFYPATSLAAEGVRATNLELLGPLLEALGHWYAALVDGGPARVLERWTALAPMARGRAVTVDDGSDFYEAVTDGVTPEGRLLVRRAGGRLVELAAADVTLTRSR